MADADNADDLLDDNDDRDRDLLLLLLLLLFRHRNPRRVCFSVACMYRVE